MTRSAYGWVTAAFLEAAVASAQASAQDVRGPTPYLSSSAAFRDLVAPSPRSNSR